MNRLFKLLLSYIGILILFGCIEVENLNLEYNSHVPSCEVNDTVNENNKNCDDKTDNSVQIKPIFQLLYRQNNWPIYPLFYKSFYDEKDFSISNTVLISSQSSHSQKLVKDSKGNPHIFYSEGDVSNNSLFYKYSIDGGITFSSEIIKIIDEGYNLCLPIVSNALIDSKDRIHLLIDICDTTTKVLYVKKEPGSSTFSTPLLIIGDDDIYGPRDSTQALIDSNDKLHLSFREFTEYAVNEWVYYRQIDPELNTISSKILIDFKNSNDGNEGLSVPKMTLDTNNNPHIVWTNVFDTGSNIYYTKSTDKGVTFNPNIQINDDFHSENSGPEIILDENNNPHVVFKGRDNRHGEYRRQYYRGSDNQGKTFNLIYRIDDGSTTDTKNISLMVNDKKVNFLFKQGTNLYFRYFDLQTLNLSKINNAGLVNKGDSQHSLSLMTNGNPLIIYNEIGNPNNLIYFREYDYLIDSFLENQIVVEDAFYSQAK